MKKSSPYQDNPEADPVIRPVTLKDTLPRPAAGAEKGKVAKTAPPEPTGDYGAAVAAHTAALESLWAAELKSANPQDVHVLKTVADKALTQRKLAYRAQSTTPGAKIHEADA